MTSLLEKILMKNHIERIKLGEIKNHVWVTQNGNNNMLSTFDNCQQVDISDEEVATAIEPVGSFLDKVKPVQNFYLFLLFYLIFL